MKKRAIIIACAAVGLVTGIAMSSPVWMAYSSPHRADWMEAGVLSVLNAPAGYVAYAWVRIGLPFPGATSEWAPWVNATIFMIVVQWTLVGAGVGWLSWRLWRKAGSSNKVPGHVA